MRYHSTHIWLTKSFKVWNSVIWKYGCTELLHTAQVCNCCNHLWKESGFLFWSRAFLDSLTFQFYFLSWNKHIFMKSKSWGQVRLQVGWRSWRPHELSGGSNDGLGAAPWWVPRRWVLYQVTGHEDEKEQDAFLNRARNKWNWADALIGNLKKKWCNFSVNTSLF